MPAEALAHWRKAKERGARAHAEWNAKWTRVCGRVSRRREGARAPSRRQAAGGLGEARSRRSRRRTATSRAARRSAPCSTRLADVAPGAGRRLGRPHAVEQHVGQGVERTSAPADYAGRYVHFGIREHGMAAIMNGMALHGGIIPYGGTFLIFSDYMRPAMRLAAFMKQRVIYIYTHDSIGLGEDGPTHQPIEQLVRAARDSGHDGDPSGRRDRDGGGVARGGRARGRARSRSC